MKCVLKIILLTLFLTYFSGFFSPSLIYGNVNPYSHSSNSGGIKTKSPKNKKAKKGLIKKKSLVHIKFSFGYH